MNTADALLLGDAVESLAQAAVLDGRSEPLPVLRAEALGQLATPTDQGTLPRPQATLVIHLSQEALLEGDGVARIDDVGPVLLEDLSELLQHRRVRVQPVVDLTGEPSADSYEIPQRIRTLMIAREPYSVFPYSTTASSRADLDHTDPYRAAGPPGQTRPSNLGPLGRREHRPKTHGRWSVSQPEAGTYRWRSPLGYEYTVIRGHTVSHRLEFTWAPLDLEFELGA